MLSITHAPQQTEMSADLILFCAFVVICRLVCSHPFRYLCNRSGKPCFSWYHVQYESWRVVASIYDAARGFQVWCILNHLRKVHPSNAHDLPQNGCLIGSKLSHVGHMTWHPWKQQTSETLWLYMFIAMLEFEWFSKMRLDVSIQNFLTFLNEPDPTS